MKVTITTDQDTKGTICGQAIELKANSPLEHESSGEIPINLGTAEAAAAPAAKANPKKKARKR